MSAVHVPEARVVEPVQDWAALENARLLNQARAALLTSGTAVTIESLAEAAGKQPGTVRRWVARARHDRRLVTVVHDGQVYVPTFQLTPAFDDGLTHGDVGQLADRLALTAQQDAGGFVDRRGVLGQDLQIGFRQIRKGRNAAQSLDPGVAIS
jgi:hypothetical protein